MHALFKKADELIKGFQQEETKETKMLPSYIYAYLKARPKGRTIRASEDFCPAPRR
jgi:hypothetical protein